MRLHIGKAFNSLKLTDNLEEKFTYFCPLTCVVNNSVPKNIDSRCRTAIYSSSVNRYMACAAICDQ